MNHPAKTLSLKIVLLTCLSIPAFATVTVVSLTPSHPSPEPIGKSISWTAIGTDSAPGPLTFQFNLTNPNGTTSMVKDFNVGTLSAGQWTSHPFVWVPTSIEGSYKIQVVVKDFATGQSASSTATFQVNAVATGSTPVIEQTANPLVALFSAPSCAAGSLMRVAFQEQTGGAPSSATSWMGCHPPHSMTFEVAGMYPSTKYTMFAQTKTGSKITNGSTATFTTRALPTTIAFPTFTVKTAAADPTYPVLLHSPIAFGTSPVYPIVATDLSANIVWYYAPTNLTGAAILMRPVPGGGSITIQDDYAWDPRVAAQQFLRQIDLAGNIVRETNTGALQQELLAKGAMDGGPCSAVPSPPPVGAACIGAFHHDAIQTLPNGWTAALLDIEKIFPPGTQGDTSGKPVDIIGDMIVVLDTNWQVQWYWDSFNPAGGGTGYTLLPVTSTAVLGETCGAATSGCPPVLLLGSTLAPLAHDWLHANSLYYWPAPQDGNATGGDILWSSRHQDWVFKLDYQDGAGTGNLLWRMGPTHTASGLTGNFTFTNTFNDPWPWHSHQHDVGIGNGGAGPVKMFDNGNTRVAPLPLGLGGGCAPFDCDSRGMVFTFTQPSGNCLISCTPGAITPVASLDLGAFSTAMGSAQLLDNGNYFFENPIVVDILGGTTSGYSLEFAPTPAAPQLGAADVLVNVAGPQHYRGWQMPSLYNPPAF